MKTTKKGISLIVLVITIIVMIILAAAIILSLNSSGIIGKANEASFKSDVKAIQEELAVEMAEAILEGRISEIEGKDAYEVLESAKNYKGMFKIYNQKLTYVGDKVTQEQKEYLIGISIEQYWDNSQAYLFTYSADGKTITGIASDFFCDENYTIYADREWTQAIDTLIIPNTVVEIRDNAFCQMGGYTNVEIPNSVKVIGDQAFCDSALRNVIVPASVTDLSGFAFADCSLLKSVTILSENISIGSDEYWFSNCPQLEEIYVVNATLKAQMEAALEFTKNDSGYESNAIVKIIGE